MASPKIVVFWLYDALTGDRLEGATPTFEVYQDDTGTPIAQPAITEIGEGAYKFTPVFPTDKWILYVINTGAGVIPAKKEATLRPEDYIEDALEAGLTDLTDVALGKWEVRTTGPDANRLILYREDGTTVLKKFDLTSSIGAPTTTNPFKRTPV